MCFIIHPNHPDVKIATEDLICLKQLEKRGHYYTSPIQNMKYFTEYRKTPKEISINKFSKRNVEINEGLHSHNKYNNYYALFFKAIIPKGTKFYYNPMTNEYVSLKLIVDITPVSYDEMEKFSSEIKLQRARLFDKL